MQRHHAPVCRPGCSPGGCGCEQRAAHALAALRGIDPQPLHHARLRLRSILLHHDAAAHARAALGHEHRVTCRGRQRLRVRLPVRIRLDGQRADVVVEDIRILAQGTQPQRAMQGMLAGSQPTDRQGRVSRDAAAAPAHLEHRQHGASLGTALGASFGTILGTTLGTITGSACSRGRHRERAVPQEAHAPEGHARRRIGDTGVGERAIGIDGALELGDELARDALAVMHGIDDQRRHLHVCPRSAFRIRTHVFHRQRTEQLAMQARTEEAIAERAQPAHVEA